MLKSALSITAALTIAAGAALQPAASPAPASPPATRALPGSSGADAPMRRALLQRLRTFRQETPLSPEQRTKILEILKKHRTEIRGQAGAARTTRTALHRAVVAGTEAQEEAAGLAESARTGALLRARLAREIRPVITPAQRERIDSAFGQFPAGTGGIATAR